MENQATADLYKHLSIIPSDTTNEKDLNGLILMVRGNISELNEAFFYRHFDREEYQERERSKPMALFMGIGEVIIENISIVLPQNEPDFVANFTGLTMNTVKMISLPRVVSKQKINLIDVNIFNQIWMMTSVPVHNFFRCHLPGRMEFSALNAGGRAVVNIRYSNLQSQDSTTIILNPASQGQQIILNMIACNISTSNLLIYLGRNSHLNIQNCHLKDLNYSVIWLGSVLETSVNISNNIFTNIRPVQGLNSFQELENENMIIYENNYVSI